MSRSFVHVVEPDFVFSEGDTVVCDCLSLILCFPIRSSLTVVHRADSATQKIANNGNKCSHEKVGPMLADSAVQKHPSVFIHKSPLREYKVGAIYETRKNNIPFSASFCIIMEPFTGGHAMIALALFQYHAMTFNFVHFMIGFILLICAIAIVIILVKWIAQLSGVAVPAPLMMVLGILLFVVLLILLLNWSGLGLW
jgi:hypothetical protein